ncbi:hypothetical protein ACMA110817_29375 [Achromobacter marplatensis]
MIWCMSEIIRGSVVVCTRTVITMFMRAAIVNVTRAATRSAMGSPDRVNRSNWVAMNRPMAAPAARIGGNCPFDARFFSQSL